MSMIEENVDKFEDTVRINSVSLLQPTFYILDRILYYRHPFRGETITIDEYNNPNTIKSYFKPLETFEDGSLVYEKSTGRMFIFGNNDKYIETANTQYTEDNVAISASIDTHHRIIVSDCPKCASNLPLKEIDENGICTCKFCGKDVYVWD